MTSPGAEAPGAEAPGCEAAETEAPGAEPLGTLPGDPAPRRRGSPGRAVVRWAGAAVAIAAAGWVAASLLRDGSVAGTGADTPRLVAAVGVGTVLYALLGVLAAAAWWRCLGLYGRCPPMAPAVALWARTQAGKYLPGNVFHYLGRQVLGRRMGLSHAELGASAALELATMLIAAAGLTAVGAAAAGGSLRLSAAAGGAALAALAVLIAADAALRRLPPLCRLAAGLPPLSRRRIVAAALPALGLHLLVLAGTGGLLWGLAAGAWAGSPLSFGHALAVYPLAWAAGTLTPGAPGGVGVREAALTVQLAPLLGEAPAALVALALRAVTVGGDLLLAGAGWLFRGREGDDEAAQQER